MRWFVFVLWMALVQTLGSVVSGDEPFDYFRNSWTVVGLKDYAHGTRINPDNELILAAGQKLRLFVGNDAMPLSRSQTKTLLDGHLPVVLISAEREGVCYDFRLWAAPLPTVKDWRAAYDWPTEGENYLNWIWVRVTNTGNAAAQARLSAERVEVAGDSPWVRDLRLAAGETKDAVLRIPFSAVEGVTFDKEDPQVWLDRTTGYWRELLSRGAVFKTADARANDALLASHVYQFINNDHGVVKGGEGFYDEFYIRDGAYEVMQFEEAGYLDAARKAMDAYLAAQLADGRFETQKGQLDANGQAVWTLWQFYQITRDLPWLEKAYPQMVRAVEWTMAARRKAPPDSPHAGVLPNALADGENLWNGQYHILGYDFWNLRGVLCTENAARALGRAADAERFAREAESYRAAIDAAWKRTGVPHFPPSWEKAGTHWGNTETLWPTPIFSLDDARVIALDREVRRQFGGGFHEGTIRWSPGAARSAIHPYMSSYTTMASLARGEHEQVVEDFYWYLLHSTAAHAFAEGIYYGQRFAWSDTIPHATGASNYAFLLRHMLVHEQGDDLHLLSAVPDWWLAEGNELRVDRAPTHFGELAMTIRGKADGVDVRVEIPRRNPPRRVVMHLPRSRPLRNPVAGVEVTVRNEQSQRWDLPAVLRLYEKIKPQPLPGLLAFPLDQPPSPSQCLLVDLKPLANTDPFSAPFGVAKPGKYLFTGMPVGKQFVAGVPFEIVDPRSNAGRGLMVLQGGKDSEAATKFPRQVVIPVGSRGKRIFFLGNVLGWSGGDAGRGELNAVAEYVLRYDDGSEQTIPLIPGKTADDWAVSPQADQVYVGLSGRPWHLHVLGAPLRPAVLKEVVFRDLGTVSAPVLAGVTIER